MFSPAASNLVLGPAYPGAKGLGLSSCSSLGSPRSVGLREQEPQSLVREEGVGGEPGGRLRELSPDPFLNSGDVPQGLGGCSGGGPGPSFSIRQRMRLLA